MRVGWTARTFRTAECIAASISSHHMAMGKKKKRKEKEIIIVLRIYYLIIKFIVRSIYYNCVSSLRPVDVEFMRALHEKVNIVPVLGKADCLTPLEVSRKKKKVRMSPSFARGFFWQWLYVPCPVQIREEIERFGINIYQFPECDSDEDDEVKIQDQDLKVSNWWVLFNFLNVTHQKCWLLRIPCIALFSSVVSC